MRWQAFILALLCSTAIVFAQDALENLKDSKDLAVEEGSPLVREKRTLLLKKKLIGAGVVGLGLGLGVGAIKGYKFGYYGQPSYTNYYGSSQPYSQKTIYVEKPYYVEKPVFVEKPVYVERPSYSNGQAQWSQPINNGYGGSNSYANSQANSFNAGPNYGPSSGTSYSSSQASASASASAGYSSGWDVGNGYGGSYQY